MQLYQHLFNWAEWFRVKGIQGYAWTKHPKHTTFMYEVFGNAYFFRHTIYKSYMKFSHWAHLAGYKLWLLQRPKSS